MADRSGRSLVVGAGGQVGARIVATLGLSNALPTARVPRAAGWLSLDLSELQSVAELERRLEGIELGAVYCVGGMTDVERCDGEAELAMRTNCVGPSLMAKFSYRRGMPFVYFSTEYIFDGEDGPYDEDSAASPISTYGRSKWEGELSVRAAHPDALIIRTTVVYGPDAAGKNFLYSLRGALGAGRVFRVPQDQVSTPTYNRDLARVSVALVQKRSSGVFHVCGPERMSRLELAQRASAHWGMDGTKIVGVATATLGQRARRPLDAGLNIAKLQTMHPELAMMGLKASLEDWDKRGDQLAEDGG